MLKLLHSSYRLNAASNNPLDKQHVFFKIKVKKYQDVTVRTILPRAISVRHNSAHYHYISHMEENKSGNSKKYLSMAILPILGYLLKKNVSNTSALSSIKLV